MDFERGEYEGRAARLRAGLAGAGVDALIVTGRENFEYLTGFQVDQPWSTHARAMIGLLPAEGPPGLIVHQLLAADAAAASWIADVRPYPSMPEGPARTVAAALLERGLARGRIGMEFGTEQRLGISQVDLLALQRELPDATWADAAPVLWRARTVKSEAELTLMRRAAEIADAAYRAAFAAVREGWSEREVARCLAETIVREGGDVGWVIATSGRGEYGRILGAPRDRRLGRGDLLFIDLGTVYRRYWSDYDRGGVVGGPTASQRELWDRIVEVTRTGVEAVRPGVEAAEVAASCHRALDAAGLSPSPIGRMGHGLGLQSAEPPHLAPYDHTVLEPGMVVTLEPCVVREDGVYVAEENVIVTATGGERLTRTAPGLRAF